MNTIWHKSDAEKQRELKILETKREVIHPELPPGFQTARECAETSKRLFEEFSKVYQHQLTGNLYACQLESLVGIYPFELINRKHR